MSPAAERRAAGVIHVVRHADALDRRSWHLADGERPLSPKGFSQARAIGERYRSLRRVRLLSSPAVRCLQTLEPAAEAGAWPIEHVRYLAEGAGGRSARAGLLDALGRCAAGTAPPAAGAGGAGVPSVVACTHGDVLQELLVLLIGDGVAVVGPVQAPKSVTFELFAENGEFCAARYIPPPDLGKS